MCNSSQWMGYRRLYFACRHPRPSNRCSLRLHRLNSTKNRKDEKEAVGAKLELRMMNLQLYMENQSIIEENEKLKKRVVSLHQENQLLSSKLHKVSQRSNQQEPEQEQLPQP